MPATSFRQFLAVALALFGICMSDTFGNSERYFIALIYLAYMAHTRRTATAIPIPIPIRLLGYSKLLGLNIILWGEKSVLTVCSQSDN